MASRACRAAALALLACALAVPALGQVSDRWGAAMGEGWQAIASARCRALQHRRCPRRRCRSPLTSSSPTSLVQAEVQATAAPWASEIVNLLAGSVGASAVNPNGIHVKHSNLALPTDGLVVGALQQTVEVSVRGVWSACCAAVGRRAAGEVAAMEGGACV